MLLASHKSQAMLVVPIAFLVSLGVLANAVGSQTGSPSDGIRGPSPSLVRSSAADALPDIAGFRPGIAFQEAYKQLRAHNPKAKLDVGEIQVAELGARPQPVTLRLQTQGPPGSDAPEIIQMELTLPPEQPIVWGILRRLFFPAGKEMTRTNLLAELRRQYGQENYGITVPIVNLYWVFDEEGRRVEAPSGPYNNCANPGPWDLTLNLSATRPGSSRFPGKTLLLDRPAQDASPCKPRVHVKALLQPSGKRNLELIESTMVAVIDAASAARAQVATAALRAKAMQKK